jgi:hypothetical protein
VLRTPSRLADLQGSAQRTSTGVSRGPGAAGGWADDHGTGKAIAGQPVRFSVPFMLTRARAHNSPPPCGSTSSTAAVGADPGWLSRRLAGRGHGRRRSLTLADVNFAVCPDDDTRLKAVQRPLVPGQPLLLTCPGCGKRFRLADNGAIEVLPGDAEI